MKKCRQGYLVFLTSCLLATCFFSSKLTFWVLLAGLCLPLVLEILLFLDVRRMRAEVSLDSSVPRGTPAAYRLTLNPALTLAAGHLHIRLEVENHLTGQRGEQTAVFALNRETDLAIELIPEGCGEYTIRCQRLEVSDLFGLCVRSLPPLPEQHLTAFPRPIPVELKIRKMPHGIQEGETAYENRKGNDPSEVFDLRDYQPQDDIRQIHWKLSSKLDTMVVKEASDTSHYDTILMLDAGWNNQPAAVLSAAVELALALSQKLIEQGIGHQAVFAAETQLAEQAVRSAAEEPQLAAFWIRLRLPASPGNGLRLFAGRWDQKQYNKMIYVTAGDFPPMLNLLDPQLDVTAITVKADQQTIHMAEKGRCQQIELPLSALDNTAVQLLI